MPSKGFTDRQKGAAAVVAAAESHATLIADQLALQLSKQLVGKEKLPDISLLVKLFGRALDGAIRELGDADDALEAERSDDDAPRRLRDASLSRLFEQITDLRELTSGVFGSAVVNTTFGGPTPQDPVVLIRFARAIVASIRAGKLGKPRHGLTWDATQTLLDIEAEIEALQAQVDKVSIEIKELQHAQVLRDEKLATYDATFSAVATVLQGLLIASGKPDLADRVRPSRRKPGHTSTSTPTETA
jgi:hypothetical protein